MDVVFRSNLDLVMKTLRENNEEAGRIASEIIVESVQNKILYGYKEPHGRPPHTEIVDTGKLFDSIQAEVKKVSQNLVSVSAGSELEYSKYVHDGYTQPAGLKFQDKDGNWYTTKGGHINGRPFMADGLQDAKPEIENAVGEAWKRGF